VLPQGHRCFLFEFLFADRPGSCAVRPSICAVVPLLQRAVHAGTFVGRRVRWSCGRHGSLSATPSWKPPTSRPTSATTPSGWCMMHTEHFHSFHCPVFLFFCRDRSGKTTMSVRVDCQRPLTPVLRFNTDGCGSILLSLVKLQQTYGSRLLSSKT
jgi:hypothetical protein